jgi:hypothetical protein
VQNLAEAAGDPRRCVTWKRDVMADLAFVLLLVGGFAVLVLIMRGLERL